MKRSGVAVSIAIALSSTAAASAETIAINEVMYRPWNEVTFGRYEFIEVYNYGEDEVDLGGYLLTDSQDLGRICQFQHPLDNEGVFEIPAGTVVGPGEYLTFWHTHIAGVTDQPGNVVYDSFLYFGNLVLANGGDQVTIFGCSMGSPVIVDSLDYSQLPLDDVKNRSLERISPFEPTQDAANWGYTTAAPGGQPPGGAYMPGGTPGAQNTIADF